MTRKDYVAIAAAIATVEAANETAGDPAGVAASTLRMVVDQVAWTLGQDNPRFDRARFEAAALPIETARREEYMKLHVGILGATKVS
jgi:hypothetical protein